MAIAKFDASLAYDQIVKRGVPGCAVQVSDPDTGFAYDALLDLDGNLIPVLVSNSQGYVQSFQIADGPPLVKVTVGPVTYYLADLNTLETAAGAGKAIADFGDELGTARFESRIPVEFTVRADDSPLPFLHVTESQGIVSKISHHPNSVPTDAVQTFRELPEQSGLVYAVMGEDGSVFFGVRSDGTIYPDNTTPGGGANKHRLGPSAAGGFFD